MSELDNMTVYIFVRQDLRLAQQLVQSNHAMFAMASTMKRGEGTPNIIVVGVPHPAALKRVLNKLEQHAIPSEIFDDPDLLLGPTAVATYPLDAEAKKPLSDYRLWRHSDANADVAQTRSESSNGEHPQSKREVTGGSPVVSSNISRCCE